MSAHIKPSANTLKPVLFFVLSVGYTGARSSPTSRLPYSWIAEAFRCWFVCGSDGVVSIRLSVAHATILVYQLISLNTAINSYDYSLLTLLLSNQFVEIKGSVFKKFEKDNLFQITCAGWCMTHPSA
jgi:hypothetical protein